MMEHMERRLSEEELSNKLKDATRRVIVGATYRHYKNQLYAVLDLAILEATNEICVIYQANYGDKLTFIRPLADWLQTVEWQSEVLPRFTKI